MIITVGTGNGYSAGVSSENRPLIHGVSSSSEHHSNIEHGYAYAMNVDVTPAADVDKHVERLPRRLWKLATRPVRFAKKVHGEAKQKRAAKARKERQDKAL